MSSQRIDRTGKVYGAVKVLELDESTGRNWLVQWRCCGKIELLQSMRVSYISKKPPERCRACIMAGVGLEPIHELPEVSLAKAREMLVKDADESSKRGLNIPGRGWWPFLIGPMGPR